MKCFFYIALILFLTFFPKVMAQTSSTYLDTSPIEHDYKLHKKPDQTGGLQKAGGLNMPIDINLSGSSVVFPISRQDLDPYRGPDVMNSCAYYESSFVTSNTDSSNAICCKIKRDVAIAACKSACNGPDQTQCETDCETTYATMSCEQPIIISNNCSQSELDQGYHWDGNSCIAPICTNQQKQDGCIEVQNPNQCLCCDNSQYYYYNPTQKACVLCNPNGSNGQKFQWNSVTYTCDLIDPCSSVKNLVNGQSSISATPDDNGDACNRKYGMGSTPDCIDHVGLACIKMHMQGTTCIYGDAADPQHVCPSGGLYTYYNCQSPNYDCSQDQYTVKTYAPPSGCSPKPPCQ